MPIRLYDKLIKAFGGTTGLADADAIEINATGFDGNLDTNTVNVQQLAQAVDDLVVGSVTIPSLHNLTINIPSRVDLNTNLNNQRTINYDVTNHSFLTALSLVVTTGDDKTLTLPVRDGLQSQTVTLSGINTSSATNVTFQLSGTYAGGTALSNIVTIDVRDLVTQEQAYYGPRPTNDFATVNLGLLTAVDVNNAGTVFTINQSVPNGNTFGILTPTGRDPVEIFDTTINRDSLNDFTLTSNVRTEGGLQYNLRTLVNNSGFTGTFNYRVTTQ